ncbi:mannitol dehydrogenase family protein [Acidothermaceae bacterium B102]|nr:mannitol dehydrogenase family protein [Acidothermaceae bacterium B102]
MSSRLSLATLRSVDPAYRPPVDPRELEVGIVHLGLGAFARAHGLVFTQGAIAATGDTRWGYCGVTQRSRTVIDQLAPQDGLYSVLVRSGTEARPQVVATARDLLFAAGEPDRLTDRLGAPTTRVVTLTVTEKGYRHDPATGRLRSTDPDVAADAAGRSPVTVVGQLVRGLAARRASGAGPVTLLSCDNLAGNGEVLRSVVLDFCELLPGGLALAVWVEDNVAFPSSMVDRITPATTPDDLAEAAQLLGLVDEGVVVTEPFSQWVVEDTFAAGRPPWEVAGVTMTADVAPYERIKLRLLNGSHSTLAYLGLLAGYTYVADAIADAALSAAISRLMTDDLTPTLDVPDGFDVIAYQAELRSRWDNTAVRHRLAQIAIDGSQKLPNRLVGSIRERRAAGVEPHAATLGIAAWMRYVSAGVADDGTPFALDDPLAVRLRAAVGGASTPAAVATALLGVTEVFGDLGADADVRRLIVGHLDTLTRHGALAAARALG